MSTKSKSIESKTDFNQDERLKKVSNLKVLLNRPELGALGGAILVFILAIGYYITPALVGGQDGQMISNFIDFHMRKSLNWNLAAAMGLVLLVIILFLFWIYDRVVGIDNMKLG